MTRYFWFYCRYDDMATAEPAELYQPSPRYWHASVNIGGKLITWGGWGDNSQQIPASSVEVFDGSWESIKTLGTPPTPTATAFTTIRSTAYNFGGSDDRGSRSNALHSLTAGEWRWRELRVLNKEQEPKPKSGSAMVSLGDTLVVVGGETDDELTNEVHCFSVGGGECS